MIILAATVLLCVLIEARSAERRREWLARLLLVLSAHPEFGVNAGE
jgi:tellurite resistance protein